MKVNCLNPIAKEGLELFSNQYEIGAEFSDAELALVRSASVHELELPQKMVAIARAGAGVNNIPLDKCAEQGIVVFNTPGANANGVKELVIGGMLLASRDIMGGCDWVKSISGEGDVAKKVEKGKKQFAGGEIYGKTLGILGLGAIGIKVANCASAMGMKVVAWSRTMDDTKRSQLTKEVLCVSCMEDVLAQSDFLSLHMALKPETKGLINREAIGKMKDKVVLLNFARDTLVNDADLKEALQSGKISCYVTDFPNDEIAGAEGVIAIPHLGASTKEAEDNCAIMAVNQLRTYAETGNIINSVNYPNCDLGPKEGERLAILYRAGETDLSGLTAGKKAAQAERGVWGYCLMEDENVKELCSLAEETAGVIRTRLI